MSTRPTAYATGTEVPIERSKVELEHLLQRFGAIGFMYGWDAGSYVIAFDMRGKRIRLVVPAPRRDEPRFHLTPTRTKRSADAAEKEWAKEHRRLWRALLLIVKAKLEAVESGIATFETEFLPYIVLPDNSTVADYMLPQIERVLADNTMPRLLPLLRDGRDE